MITEDMQHERFISDGKKLSPFELKDALIQLVKSTEKRTAYTFLNAGRGNPNWTASTPREAFFTFGQFAVEETKRVMEAGDLAGLPYKEGIANHLLAKRDHIALIIPIFTPYLDIPELSRYEFKVTYIYASCENEQGRHTWQYPKEELDKIEIQTSRLYSLLIQVIHLLLVSMRMELKI